MTLTVMMRKKICKNKSCMNSMEWFLIMLNNKTEELITWLYRGKTIKKQNQIACRKIITANWRGKEKKNG